MENKGVTQLFNDAARSAIDNSKMMNLDEEELRDSGKGFFGFLGCGGRDDEGGCLIF